MIYYSGWRKEEIEKLTISEIIDYVNQFNEIEHNKIKAFASYNLISVRLAVNGKKEECEKYLNDLKKENKENNLEDQFDGVDFG